MPNLMISLQQLTTKRGGFSLPPVTVDIPQGAYAVLMGPTGCGKTSLLECIAGLVPASGGKLLVEGKDITLTPPSQRGLGYVPQDGALFAGLTVAQNLGFGLEVRKVSPAEIKSRVDEISAQLGITHLLARQVHGLSGGERQRVAIGRALAFRPLVLLLDEPLTALDETTRGSMCELLQSIHLTSGTTFLHVTHSTAEADALATLRLQLRDLQPA